jgi:DNA-directed RNA polymerase II subunit RPB2
MSSPDSIAWNIIDKYFKDNPYNLVAHHLDSYNDFFSKGIFQIFKENNPIRFVERETETISGKKSTDKAVKIGDKENPSECRMYLGGKNGDKIYFGKPIIYDDISPNDIPEAYPHYMYPNDARLRSMTYGITIHYDVDVEFDYYVDGIKTHEIKTLDKIYLGRFPIMLHSNLCILRGLSTEARFHLGECRNDFGGYFVIDGKEKCILSQEKFADNMLYVRKNKVDDLYSFSCEVHSVSEDSSKPIRYSSVKIIAPDSKYTNNQIVVDIPNIKKPVPLFILMRALGIVSDKSIIQYCLLDLESNSNMIDLFIPSIHDANQIFSQMSALEYLRHLTKRNTITSVIDILMNYFLPHIGEDNFLNKAYYIGFMVNKILRVYMGREKPTDRDNFKFKRIETSGTLIYGLFREYYLMQAKSIFLRMDKEFYYQPGKYRANFPSLIEDNYREYFKTRVIEDGFKKGFKGNWGADENTRRVGLVQDLNRLSWFTFISHLRKISLSMDPTSKVVAPHLLHSSQWGFIDPVDTPDGGNIGLHKHMAISTAITNGFSSYPLIKWLRANTPLKLLLECNSVNLASMTKMFVNGNWIGVIENPIETVNTLKLFRRNGIIPMYTSISFSYETNVVYLYTDSGRLTRPIFYRNLKIDEATGSLIYGSISYNQGKIKEQIESREYTWQQAVSGFETKRDEKFAVRNNILYDTNVLYPGFNSLPELLDMFEQKKGIIDYIDTAEEESALIATSLEQIKSNRFYTNVEIDPSLMFGVMGNSVTYPEDNQLPRNVFSCGQSRQAVSVYHSNYQMRLDKMGVVLNYGQTPLIKSRYLEYINHEEQPYGVNAIVAIMSYTGYNVEDAILINKGSIDRGIFRTMYYTSYEARETSSKVGGMSVNSSFTNIQAKQNVTRLKEDYDYSQLDEHGLVKENTLIDEKVILIGHVSSNPDQKGEYTDESVTTKKGQLGYVDKSFISEGEEGFRIAKIRIREERLPAIGDKMASRCGQKGTLGLILPEEDMPFCADGTRPDLIINPHALPSRMTIGQLVECLFGKACALYGAYGDCTAYAQKGANYKTYGEMLTKMDFHCSGNQLLYNGYTGEQIYSEIFIGPTYYMRLKHMVKDKINYRATGKRSALTRQTNQGRANDGGLRIGEMERDGIMGHGLSYFLNESYMVRGDQYYMAVCNKTGTIAIYNPDKNLFLSPMSDGPLKFSRSPEGEPILDVFSRFGRSFSLLRVPYALKLLIQELQVLNIQMRIITEENVDQLLNLSYQSKNLNKLMNIADTDFKDIGELTTHYKKQLDDKVKNASHKNVEKLNKKAGLELNLKNMELQKFEGINIPNSADKEDADKHDAEKREFAKEINDLEVNNKWDNNAPNAGPWEPQNEFPSSSSTAKPWEPQNEFPSSSSTAKPWEPQNEFPSSSTASYNSPGFAPPDFNDPMLKQYWAKLTNEEQSQILALPDEQQEESTKKMIINRPQPPFQMPNYGSNGELNQYFSDLPRLEQIELLKLSHKRQIEKLTKMAADSPNSNDFSKLRIVIPENKTSSEELYGSPALKLLAPENTPVTEKKTPDDVSGGSSSSSSSSSSNSNIKRVTF